MKTVTTILVLLFAQMSQASFLDHCDFEAEVIITKQISSPLMPRYRYSKNMTVLITDAKSLGGHTDCRHYIGTEMTLDVEAAALSDLASVQAGSKINLDYFYANSFSPDGVIENTSVKIKSKAEEALNLAMADEKVQDRMDVLKKELKFGGDPVVVLAAHSQYLPEGICGFAGCESTYSVTLTLGQDYRNSSRKTIFVKVTIIGSVDNFSVELIK